MMRPAGITAMRALRSSAPARACMAQRCHQTAPVAMLQRLHTGVRASSAALGATSRRPAEARSSLKPGVRHFGVRSPRTRAPRTHRPCRLPVSPTCLVLAPTLFPCAVNRGRRGRRVCRAVAGVTRVRPRECVSHDAPAPCRMVGKLAWRHRLRLSCSLSLRSVGHLAPWGCFQSLCALLICQ